MAEFSMTKSGSLIQVIFNGEILIIDFPFDRRIINRIRTIKGADWNNRVEKKWTLPKEGYKSLMKEFDREIIWKTPEELKESQKEFRFKEETLEDVLDRIPKNIETPFMKLEPYDFQKVAVGWAVTKKGKKAGIYGGLLGDLMG